MGNKDLHLILLLLYSISAAAKTCANSFLFHETHVVVEQMVHKKWKLDVPDEHQLGFCNHQPTAEKPQIKMTTPDHCV